MNNNLSNKNILLVDDSRIILECLKEVFLLEGMNVLTAVNGVEALDIVCHRPVDVIILDIEMPVMNGFQLCRIVKKDEKLKSIPIILLTTRPAEEDKNRIWGFRAGADSYLNKNPFDQKVILSTVASLVQE